MEVAVIAALLGYLLLDVCGAPSLPGTGNERQYWRALDLRSFDALSRVTRDNQNNSIPWYEKLKIPLAAGLGGGGLLVILAVVLIVIVCCLCLKQRSRHKHKHERRHLLGAGSGPRYNQPYPRGREQQVSEAMTHQRKMKEMEEKQRATDTVQYFLRNNSQYKYDSDLGDLGSRMQKHWFKVTLVEEDKQKKTLLLTTTPVSQKCPLKLDKELEGIKKLMKELQKHPLLQPVKMVDYLASKQQVVVVQPFRGGGSLKDTIYRATPTTDWSNKYSRRSRGLKLETVRSYGRQILEAMMFLYEHGFPTLGHVQSGNVFVVNNTCFVGGYENTLLGYKTRLYRLCKEHHEHLDVIMFGHLVFEMCCGYELTDLVPGSNDYKAISNDEEKEILHYIFQDGFPHGIKQIKDKEFFSVTLTQLEGFDADTVKTSAHKSIENVLEKVRKGKPRHQKVPKATAPTTAPPTTSQAAQPPPQDIDKTPVVGGKGGASSDLATLTVHSTSDHSDSGKTEKQNGLNKIFGGGKKETTGSGDDAGDKTPLATPLVENA